MAILMGKHKMNEWEELDRIDPSSPDIEEEKQFLEDMYREEKGRGWLFKWEYE